VRLIDAELAQRISPTSWREGCPVDLSELRYLRLSHWGPDLAVHEGELIVNASVVDEIVTVFGRLFDARFPIAQMRLIDDFGGDDLASVAANNTSAFNCRPTTGGTSWSQHAYGLAIDINPLWNPYVGGDEVIPAEGAEFVDRSREFVGKIDEGGPVVAAFDSMGWSWGGRFNSITDWQHFSKDGG
jgi:poly-gamma-glutamate synthesis protein (capsule biosynthesis protein)